MPLPDLRTSRALAVTRGVVAALGLGLAVTAAADAATGSLGKELLQPFLEEHCVKCHSGDDAKHDLRLDELAFDLERKELRKQWDDVLEQIESGEMPPKKKARPAVEEVRAITAMLRAKLGEAEERRRATEGRVVLRRLNRAEYENTIHDLLGVGTPLRDLLPEDSTAHGFDNAAEVLQTSSFLLERYLEAADTALRDAIANRPKPKVVKLRNTVVQGHRFKSDTERVYRRLEGDTVALFSSSHWNAVELSQLWPQERGRYRYRISAYAVQSQGKPVTFSVMNGDGGMGGAKSHLVGYFDAPPDKPEFFEFVDLVEPRTGGSILPYGTAMAHKVSKIGAETYDGPGVAIEWMEVEGPLNETWPPPSHRAIFGDLPQGKVSKPNQNDRLEVASEEPLKDAERIVRSFACRAFRHPVNDAELTPYLALAQAKLEEHRSFEQAVRVGLTAILTSPDFLFFREKPGKLDDFALASRLSYFLWSSMPDDELLAFAERGELHDPTVLRGQVDRLLNHEKAAAFAQNFAGQWLGLRDIDATEPSQFLYPEFDNMLKVSMVREAELFFQEVLKDDLSIADFLSSDFSILNGRLAKHYGIPGVDGWTFRKTTLPPESHRGGLLTMAAVLKVTANGTTTSPVKRGVWVLDRILGTPPKPPPRDAGSLEPDTRGSLTIREQLAKHRRVETCASCHVTIDPPGFALESFDVIGGWRERYRATGNGAPVVKDGVKMAYLDGPKVDPGDSLPDGRKFADINEFKRLLLEQMEPFARALAAKLITYATGDAPNRVDEARITSIVSEMREKNYGFRSLVHAVVQSELFRQK